ncbi:hypothetical protein KQX54_002875 [Cotesia glomerata]|uniref:Uncharacterized protein n=1 Tax=Cotesia glomerata TaxID=32391 RepID=A0AAV7I1K7_COTGL|nr:hypothetical protein KQX54_002875 [Cotesia glomerata]
MADLSAGDTININYLNPKSTETYGGIFNGYNNNASHFIGINIASVEQISIEKKICLPFKSLASYYYPSVNVDEEKLDLSKIFNFTNKDNLFDISPYYIREKYSYGIVKACQIVKSQKLISKVLNQDDLTMLNEHINYNLLLETTGVLRLRQENETHYVSSITTGRCLLQVYVNLAELCSQNRTTDNDIENFIEYSRYFSRIKINTGNRNHEDQLNTNVNLFQKKLYYHFRHLLSEILLFDHFQMVSENNVVELNLKTLPDLLETISPRLYVEDKFLSSIIPGDVIDINSLKRLDSLIEADNFLLDINDNKIPQFTVYNFTTCNEFNENDPIELEIAPYGLHPDYFTEPVYKFDVVDQMAKRRNYGVDPKYLNERYKCLKVKICSEIKRRKLILSSLYVVNLDKNNISKLHFFDSKNVVLRYKLSDETHYVARTEKGNCLFQALIYENLDDSSHTQQIQGPLLYIGDILSTYNGQNVEKWAEKYVSDLSVNGLITLMNLILDRSAVTKIFSKISENDYEHGFTTIYLGKIN